MLLSGFLPGRVIRAGGSAIAVRSRVTRAQERREVHANEAKTEVVATIKEKLTSNDGVILVDYRGLSVKEMQEFRTDVSDAGGEVKVYKNTLTEIAVRELAMPSMDEFLVGPTCFIFVPR